MFWDLDACWVESGVQVSSHLQAGSGCGGADKFQGLLITVQGLGCPIPADLTEQTMLDGIPFGGTGRVVRDGDDESEAIAQLPLNLLLPGTTLRAITATGISQDEDVAGLGIAFVSFRLPPLAKTGDGEGGRFVGSPQEHTASVGLGIVDAIPNADSLGGGAEVMIVDLSGGLLPFSSGILEVTDQLPLFGIHAQDRITALFELITLSAEIAELAVAVGSRTGGNLLAIGAQGILHLPQ